ncbi:MAG: hypothetical protein ACR2IE_17980 [Candidatus Sumerlaeaceae bacterium]
MGHLAKYLYSLRIERGFESVSDYLSEYQLPISPAYYRSLESASDGGKNIAIETAERLCAALKADQTQFFLHFLKDLLPAGVFKGVIREIPLKSYGTLRERRDINKHDVKIYREALAKAIAAESYIPSDEVLQQFIQRTDWLPLLHYIYLVSETSREELCRICKNNGIRDTVDGVISKLVELGVIKEVVENGKHFVRRNMPIFRVPLTDSGKILKNVFTIRETERSIAKARTSDPVREDGSFMQNKIAAYTPEAAERIRRRILDLLAEEAAGGGNLQKNSQVYYFSVIVSSRPEYMAEAPTQVENGKHPPTRIKTKKIIERKRSHA